MTHGGSKRNRWFAPRALVAHLCLAIWFPGCLVAGWWQVNVATSGNGLAYLYAVEWPIFALFGVALWWNVVHDDPNAFGNKRLAALRRENERDRLEVAKREHGFDLRANREPMGPDLRVGRDESVRSVSDGDESLRAYNDYLERLASENRPKTWRRR